MLEIREATTKKEIESAWRLAYAFISWLQQTYPEAHDVFEPDLKAVESDLASLAGADRLLTDKLLVAYFDDEIVGTVALRDLGQRCCEMKQMFVDAKFRGQGLGRTLAAHLIRDARALGYRQMRLSTGVRQVAALNLYRYLGFQEISPYHDVPESLRPHIVFMVLPL
jgi:ribosomal protein S18 acetylase RimI-like enzyme